MDVFYITSIITRKLERVTDALASSNEHSVLLSHRNDEESEMMKAQIDVLEEHNK